MRVHDLSLLKPFEGASNLTATFVAEKGRKTEYPVPYTVWIPRHAVNPPSEKSLVEILQEIDLIPQKAYPLTDAENSHWRTSSESATGALEKVLGESSYKAAVGARIEPYGVYLLRILAPPKNNRVLVENMPETGKRSIQKVQAEIETDLLYPIARGKDVERWFVRGDTVVLIVQDPKTRRGFEIGWLKRNYPLTYSYLNGFKHLLESRAAYKKYHAAGKHAFYSMFNIDEDTFAPYKVAWRRMGVDFRATIISTIHHKYLGERKLIASDTVTIVPFDSKDESYYLAGLLNSTPGRAAIYSYSPPGRGLGTPSILKTLAIEKYRKRDELHQGVAKAAETLGKLHQRSAPPYEEIKNTELQLDESASRYWKLSTSDMAELKSIVEDRELRGDESVRGTVKDIHERMFDVADSQSADE